MKPIDPSGFEAMFRENADPWDYATSPFEASKRDTLLKACGAKTYGRGLELACANGETTLRLAERCLSLLAVDSSETVVREAQRRTSHLTHLTVTQAVLPAETPTGPFDLIVASEILYYLPEADMMDLLLRLRRALTPGGRFVCLHHIVPFADASQPPAIAQKRAKAFFASSMPVSVQLRTSRFEVFAVDRPRGVQLD